MSVGAAWAQGGGEMNQRNAPRTSSDDAPSSANLQVRFSLSVDIEPSLCTGLGIVEDRLAVGNIQEAGVVVMLCSAGTTRDAYGNCHGRIQQ